MEFRAGDTVPRSGVYLVDHHSHRLMHEATLISDSRFPRCKKCKDGVRFRLLRAVEDSKALPFHTHAVLEEYADPEDPPIAKAV
jgi:hypothetical protein